MGDLVEGNQLLDSGRNDCRRDRSYFVDGVKRQLYEVLLMTLSIYLVDLVCGLFALSLSHRSSVKWTAVLRL